MKIRKVNDSVNHGLHYTGNDVDGAPVVGQFYDSKSRKYHLAEYVPYGGPPRQYLCGDMGNFSPSRSEDPNRRVCPSCYDRLVCDFTS
jgi:hypothetical protein